MKRLQEKVLPDHWKTSCYQLNYVNDASSDFKSNNIPLSDWQRVLEPSGAVFLPMAGARTIDGVYEELPTYQTSTAESDCAYIVQHCCIDASAHRGDGFAVRLVQEVE